MGPPRPPIYTTHGHPTDSGPIDSASVASVRFPVMSDFDSDCVVETTIYNWYSRLLVPKLYRYANEGKWHKIPNRCKSHPSEAKFVHKYPPYRTALHCLVRMRIPLEFAEAQNPERDMDSSMRNEMRHLRRRAVFSLLQANPAGASTMDCFGRTPLHLACINACSSSEGTIELLLDVCPMAACLTDEKGQTPLHLLLKSNESVQLDLLEKMVAACPRAVQICDTNGQTPADIITSKQNPDLSALKLLLNALQKLLQ